MCRYVPLDLSNGAQVGRSPNVSCVPRGRRRAEQLIEAEGEGLGQVGPVDREQGHPPAGQRLGPDS